MLIRIPTNTSIRTEGIRRSHDLIRWAREGLYLFLYLFVVGGKGGGKCFVLAGSFVDNNNEVDFDEHMSDRR